MKKNVPVSVLAGMLTLTVLLSGCSLFQKDTTSSESSSSAASSSSSQSASSAAGASSGQSSAPAESAESQPGRVLTITTDSETFNEKFAQNPLDKAYIKESDEAVSTVDMVNVSQKYAELWEKEIDHAWSELSLAMSADSNYSKPEQLKAEQQKWEDAKDTSLKKIESDALSIGGSMVEVEAASQKMDFYRSRAAQLYRELYDYDNDYSYAYSAS